MSLISYIRSRFNQKALPSAEIDVGSIRYIDAEETIEQLMRIVIAQNTEILQSLKRLNKKPRKLPKSQRASK